MTNDTFWWCVVALIVSAMTTATIALSHSRSTTTVTIICPPQTRCTVQK